MMKENKIMYTNKYTDLSRETVINRVREVISKERFDHVLRVEQRAVELAEMYEADIEKVSIAALTHDFAKEQPDEEMRDTIISENMDLELLNYGNNIWHGPVGAILVKKQLRVSDNEILEAIRNHTIGSPNMGLIEKIIYTADFTEPDRDFEEAEEAYRKSQESLDKAIAYITRQTIKKLVKQRKKIYPKAIETYNAWSTNKEANS